MSEQIPDPTARTLDTVNREVKSLEQKIAVAMDYRGQLFDEKFSSVKREFDLVERNRIEQKADTKQAVDAALIAQKEAVREQTLASEKSIAKSETATAKQIDQQGLSYDRVTAALNTIIGDLKDRLVVMESAKKASSEDHASKRLDTTFLLQAVSIGVAVFLGLHHK